ncbi:hypothetical protein Cs7R123_62430 [Catellatospora sp. TT07R-123]|uniref:hypothetical protein n=1 Tax=Catellatospora sp. TT07R-123 TaxID=2733863 RepID=UPI001B18F04F|nr:hypothetical protein [Catellatospora sp. TT07R-123]GHJ48901.1 hypothetical protein Cs7R123_62430 [Catellatospora sp. TT07R-123]
MPKKIGDTKLVATYGTPNISYGQSTGLLKHKPLLTFKIGNDMHVTIIPDDGWCMSQMMYESGEDYENTASKRLHTNVADLTFDEFHVTDEQTKASTFITVTGTLGVSESTATKEAAQRVGSEVIGYVKTESKTKV